MKMVNEILESTSRKAPHKPALIFDNTTITYKEVETTANRCAHGLISKGIKQGDMAGILIPNSPEFIYAYFGIIKAGATVVPMNPTLSENELHYMIKDANIKAVFTVGPLLPLIQKIASQLKNLKIIIVTGRQEANSEIDFTALLNDKSSVPPQIRVENNEPAVCIYTSGTTGNSKGALLTHKNLLSNINSILKILPTENGDVFSCFLPLFHAYAAMVSLLTPLTAGACISVSSNFSPRKCLQTIEADRISIFIGVPAMFAVLTHIKNPSGYNLNSLRFCVAGGAPMSPPALNKFEEIYSVKIYEGDGPTECSPVTSVNPIGGKRKIGSIGLPIPDVEMQIIDEAGNKLPPEAVGEIVVRGPNVMKGYLNQLEATKESITNGWFHTGDIGKVDEEGYFYILDRKKDMIIVGGLNVYAQEVEKVLLSHHHVSEAAVIGKPDRLRGEVPIAFVIPAEEEKIDSTALITFCREHLASYKVPRQIETAESFPKTATGKVMKWKLKDQAAR